MISYDFLSFLLFFLRFLGATTIFATDNPVIGSRSYHIFELTLPCLTFSGVQTSELVPGVFLGVESDFEVHNDGK